MLSVANAGASDDFLSRLNIEITFTSLRGLVFHDLVITRCLITS